MYKAQSSVYIHLLIQEYLCPEHEKHYLYWSDKQTSSLRVTKVMNTVVSYQNEILFIILRAASLLSPLPS